MKTIIKYNNKQINYQEPTTIKDRLIISLEYWWLELDENNAPIREMGFAKDHSVQIAAPTEADAGIWCESNICFDQPKEYEHISLKDFENKWKEFFDQ